VTVTDEPAERATAGRIVELADLVDRVLSAPATLGSSRLVCIDGPSGAGKTTLARRLRHVARRSSPIPVTAVHMDDLYDGWGGLVDAALVKVPQWLLAPLSQSRDGSYRRYDWRTGSYAEWHRVAPGGLVVLEGCGSAARPADAFATLRLWIDTDPAVRLRRGLDRSGDEVLPYLQAWKRAEDAHFAADRTRERADVRVLGAPATGVDFDPATQVVVEN
jgi:uridine kinase